MRCDGYMMRIDFNETTQKEVFEEICFIHLRLLRRVESSRVEPALLLANILFSCRLQPETKR